MESRIDVTVAAIVEHQDRFLVVEERVAGRLVFNQPAGHLEPGETLVDAAVREVREETGFAFAPDAVVGIYLWDCEPAGRTFLRVAFAGTATAPGHDPVLDDGIVATHWLTREQLLSPRCALRSPLVLRSIDDFRRGIRFPLSCLQYVSPEPANAALRA